MKLIAITTETFFEGETEAVNMLFENGLETLHLRKPYASQQEMEDFINQVNKDFHSRIVLHDYHELIKNEEGEKGAKGRRGEGAKGVFCLKGIHIKKGRHFDRFDTSTCSAHRKLTDHRLSDRGTVSGSCHSFEEVLEARFCDYVFLSPIFDSISKAGYKQGFTSEQLQDAKERMIINERVIALGGITADNIYIVRAYGFGGVAVLGSLWGNYAIDRDSNELLQRFNKLKNKCLEV